MNFDTTLAYPYVQVEAGKSSRLHQNLHYGLIIINLSLLVATGGVGLFNSELFTHPKTLLLSLSLLIAFLLKSLKLDRRWFASRSLSETVKTLTWRYTMAAHPFDVPHANLTSDFILRVQEACTQTNKIYGSQKFFFNDSEPTIRATAGHSLESWISFYVRFRLKNQSIWYSSKAQKLKSMSSFFFCLLVGSNVIAVVLSGLEESGLVTTNVLTGLLISAATALVGWIEAKKYGEMAAAYTLTHSEILSLNRHVHDIHTFSQLASFVAEAESLFSREHTQWAAKRGSFDGLNS
ncbi:DUF4231 domain-containing protein [Pseudomonas viridiflava]|uniref:DUF4231 domain-containing protein n=1 Tax=Pseudomonas viridiflava TaxID=33069 RepID=UPI0013CF30D0|nr:DUF4231 domain-containing protein [Pseudomonas viridiflava]MEE4071382.1 DUF4231 domain-containing protein [Pseudomonas viridiflava]